MEIRYTSGAISFTLLFMSFPFLVKVSEGRLLISLSSLRVTEDQKGSGGEKYSREVFTLACFSDSLFQRPDVASHIEASRKARRDITGVIVGKAVPYFSLWPIESLDDCMHVDT